MELKQLEAFVHVVELGSFTRAATILDTNQPTLSRLVRQLEVELRQTLLVRHGRGVVASDAGQIMLGHAKGMLLQAERARHDLRQLQGTVSGHFSIGLAPSFAKVATQELIRQFRQRFPDATISVAEGLSTYLTEWLMMGRIDAAVLYDTSLTALVEKRAVFEEELFLIGMAGGAEWPGAEADPPERHRALSARHSRAHACAAADRRSARGGGGRQAHHRARGGCSGGDPRPRVRGLWLRGATHQCACDRSAEAPVLRHAHTATDAAQPSHDRDQQPAHTVTPGDGGDRPDREPRCCRSTLPTATLERCNPTRSE